MCCHSFDRCILGSLQWRHNGRDGVTNHQPLDCLLNCLFRRRSKNTSKLCVTGLCEWNSPVMGEFPSQRASNAENVSIWWRHHGVGILNAESVPQSRDYGDVTWASRYLKSPVIRMFVQLPLQANNSVSMAGRRSWNKEYFDIRLRKLFAEPLTFAKRLQFVFMQP